MIEVIKVGGYVLLEALSILYCLHYLYGEKVYFNIATISYLLVDLIWMSIIQLFHLNHGWSLLIYPFIGVYCGVRFGFHLKKILVNNVLYISILSVIQATIAIIFNVLLGIKRVGELESIFLNAFVFLIVICILKKCKLDKLSKTFQSNEKIIAVSITVVMIIVFLFIYSYKQYIGFNELYYILLGISLLLIIGVSIDIGKHKMKVREAQAELRLHRLYETSFRDLIDDICAKQHEFDNHINAIYSQHFVYKTYEDLVDAQKKYCNEIVKENRYNSLLSKGNPVILSFLYSKFLEMEKKEIDITFKISIVELDCKVPVYKMVELLGNLIKNAVDAVEINRMKKIHVLMIEGDNDICIEISNPSPPIDSKKMRDFFRKGYSEKGQNRGFGLYNVKKICEEYNIAIIYDNISREETNWFVLKLVINKPL